MSAAAAPRLPLATKLAYAAPNFAGSAMAIGVGIHMNIFYSDVVLIPLGYIALAVALARSFDAITDPLMGWITDRTNTRWGRRRPWMFVAAPLQAVALILLFSPPRDLETAALTMWFTACFLGYFLFHTILTIPHYGLGPELTRDYHERSSLFAWLEGFTLLGIIYASGVPRLVTQRLLGERLGFTAFAVLTGVLLIGLYWSLCARIRESPEYYARAPNPLVPGVRRTMRNRPFRILLASYLAASMTAGITGMLMPFFVIYVLKPPNAAYWVPWLLMLIFVSGVVALPAWVAAARRFGKRRTLVAARMLAVATFTGFFFLGEGDVAAYAVIVAFAGVANGGYTFLGPAIQADVIDYDELHTGKRREAQYGALWAILTKFTMIPSAAIPLGVLATLGYAPNVDQNETVVFAITALYGLAPAAASLLSLALFLAFPIDEAGHRAILEGIERHRRGEPARDPLTGRLVPPPAARGVDEETGWFLDHFSRRELRGLAGRGVPGLSHRVWWSAIASLAVFASAALVVLSSVGDLRAPPGVATVFAIVVAGAGLAAFFYHAVRVQAARALRVRPLPAGAVRAHLLEQSQASSSERDRTR